MEIFFSYFPPGENESSERLPCFFLFVVVVDIAILYRRPRERRKANPILNTSQVLTYVAKVALDLLSMFYDYLESYQYSSGHAVGGFSLKLDCYKVTEKRLRRSRFAAE